MMEASDEWIVQRTGIRERRWVEPETPPSALALEAARAALSDAGIGPADLDMIFLATLSPDHFFPGTACFLQAKLDVPVGVPAIDVRQQCSGFIYATAIADQFIRSGAAQRVLVVGAEIHSKALDKTTAGRDVTVIFGDGAGAVVLQAPEVTDPLQPHIPPPPLPLDANGHSLEEVDVSLFHQANLPINEAVAKNLGIPTAKVFNTIEWTGNTSAATIPIGMTEARAAGLRRPGSLVAAAVFGSGLTWASMLGRWGDR